MVHSKSAHLGDMKLVLVPTTNAIVQGFCLQHMLLNSVEGFQVTYSKLGSQTMTERFVFRTTQGCQVGTALTVIH